MRYRSLLLVVITSLCFSACALFSVKSSFSLREELQAEVAEDVSYFVSQNFSSKKNTFYFERQGFFPASVEQSLRGRGYSIYTSGSRSNKALLVDTYLSEVGENLILASVTVGSNFRASRIYEKNGSSITPSTSFTVMQRGR